jgi:hypothetical protein
MQPEWYPICICSTVICTYPCYIYSVLHLKKCFDGILGETKYMSFWEQVGWNLLKEYDKKIH